MCAGAWVHSVESSIEKALNVISVVALPSVAGRLRCQRHSAEVVSGRGYWGDASEPGAVVTSPPHTADSEQSVTHLAHCRQYTVTLTSPPHTADSQQSVTDRKS